MEIYKLKIMARKNKYQVDEVLRSLAQKHDVKINADVKVVEVLTGKDAKFQAFNDLGNGSWGKIDYLVNYCNWRQIDVDRF